MRSFLRSVMTIRPASSIWPTSPVWSQPSDQRPLGLRRVAPIALHDQLAANQYLAVLGDPDLGILQRRPDRVHLDARLRPVAADHRRRLGLAVALEDGEPDRVEEDPDVRIERRSARDHRLHPAAEAGADLGPEQPVEHEVHRPVPQALRAGIIPGADLERPLHHVIGELALLLDILEDALPQHLEQPRHHDHHRRLDLLDVRGELLQPFGIIDLRADPDREELAAAMLIGVAGRKEGEEDLLVRPRNPRR